MKNKTALDHCYSGGCFVGDNMVHTLDKINNFPGTGKGKIFPSRWRPKPWFQKVSDFYHFGKILDLFRGGKLFILPTVYGT